MRLTPGSRWRRLMWLKSAHVEEELSQQSPDLNMTRPRVSRVPLDVYGCIIDSVEDNDWPDLVAFLQTCKVFWTACNALKVWRPLCLRLGYGLPTEPLRGSCFKQDWRALAAGLAKAKAVGWKSLDLHVQPKRACMIRTMIDCLTQDSFVNRGRRRNESARNVGAVGMAYRKIVGHGPHCHVAFEAAYTDRWYHSVHR